MASRRLGLRPDQFLVLCFLEQTVQAAAFVDTSPPKTPPLDAPLPRDFHNFFVVLVGALVAAWMGKVLYQFLSAMELNNRLARSRSLQLEGMSVYAADFQLLIRQHFNQILRIRRTVPPKPVERHALSVHLHPESVEMCFDEVATSRKAFGVQFTVDASVPCCLKLFWGISVRACNDFVQRRQLSEQLTNASPSKRSNGRSSGRGSPGDGNAVEGGSRGRRWRPSAAQDSARSLLEMESIDGLALPGLPPGSREEQAAFPADQYRLQSREFFLPAGRGQQFVTPAADLLVPGQLNFDVSAAWLCDVQAAMDDGTAVMPLAIMICAHRRPASELGQAQGRPVLEAHGEVSFVKFRAEEGSSRPRAPEIIRQLTFGDQASMQEIHGVYGFEEEGDTDCMICYAKPKNVLLLPCRHCSVCHTCLRSLRDEKCPLCRSMFSSYVTLPLDRAPQPSPPAGNEASGLLPRPSVPAAAGAGQGVCSLVRPVPPQPQPAGTLLVASSEGHVSSLMAVASPPPSSGSSPSQGRAPAEEASAVPLPRPAAAQGEPARQQARELHLGRPRGTPAPRGTARGLRLGRARFGERLAGNASSLSADSADAPLLQQGMGAAGLQQVWPVAAPVLACDTDSEACRGSSSHEREGVPGQSSGEVPVTAEETRVLIQDNVCQWGAARRS